MHNQKAEPSDLNTAREEFCNQLMGFAIPAFFDYTEVVALQYKAEGDPDRLNLMVDDTVFQIDRFSKWLTAMNLPELLKLVGDRSPCTVDRRTLRPIDDVVRRIPKDLRNTATRKLNVAIDRLVAVGKPKAA